MSMFPNAGPVLGYCLLRWLCGVAQVRKTEKALLAGWNRRAALRMTFSTFRSRRVFRQQAYTSEEALVWDDAHCLCSSYISSGAIWTTILPSLRPSVQPLTKEYYHAVDSEEPQTEPILNKSEEHSRKQTLTLWFILHRHDVSIHHSINIPTHHSERANPPFSLINPGRRKYHLLPSSFASRRMAPSTLDLQRSCHNRSYIYHLRPHRKSQPRKTNY